MLGGGKIKEGPNPKDPSARRKRCSVFTSPTRAKVQRCVFGAGPLVPVSWKGLSALFVMAWDLFRRHLACSSPA